MAKINFQKEWDLLTKCEKNAHTGIAAKQRFIQLLSIIPEIQNPKKILDVGGNFATAKWFKEKFPNSTITILNKSSKELSSYPNVINADAQNFQTRQKYDLIFCGETIEHLYNPDGLLASCILALKPKGHFVITTPNLSCIHNRLFLLFGLSLANYSPSLRYTTGNPYLKNKLDGFGFTGDHKSLFTWQGLIDLLEKYGFKIIFSKGFGYAQTEKIQTIGKRYIKTPWSKFRMIINNLLPHHLREGMMFVCQAPRKINNKHALRGILNEDLWGL